MGSRCTGVSGAWATAERWLHNWSKNFRVAATARKAFYRRAAPFENISGDPEQEYFTDGITEDIITALSKISELRDSERQNAGGDISMAKPVDEDHLLASTQMLLQRTDKSLKVARYRKQRFLVVTIAGVQTVLHAMPDRLDQITNCSMEQLDERLNAGFDGILVVPSETVNDLDFQRIFETTKVRGVVIDGSRS